MSGKVSSVGNDVSGGGDTVGGDISGGGDTGGGDTLGDLDLLFFLVLSGGGETVEGGDMLGGGDLDLFFFVVLPGGLGLLNFALYAVTGGCISLIKNDCVSSAPSSVSTCKKRITKSITYKLYNTLTGES